MSGDGLAALAVVHAELAGIEMGFKLPFREDPDAARCGEAGHPDPARLSGPDEGTEQDVDRIGAAATGSAAVQRSEVVRFREERGPAARARFVRGRVIDREAAYWRRGSAGGHPLGVRGADQRRYYSAGTLEASPVEQSESLWTVQCAGNRCGPARGRGRP
ncbi:hypothetical protein QZN11_04210 [Streptomyces gramineus]|uniref:hypothetical protein n=1 Tax=Streptomyces gramineus TaxID=910542 RepID=UPI00398B0A60